MENPQGPAVQHRGLCSILCNNLMVPRGKDGEGIVRESGIDMDTLLCLTWRMNKDLLDSTGNSSGRHVAGWMGGEFGREWICVLICLAESLRCSPETITTLLIGYTPTQNKKF